MAKIMIVENDIMVADYLEDVLTEAGYDVCCIAADVDAAIELGHQHSPDLGIIDLRLSEGRYGTEVGAALWAGGNFGVLDLLRKLPPALAHSRGKLGFPDHGAV